MHRDLSVPAVAAGEDVRVLWPRLVCSPHITAFVFAILLAWLAASSYAATGTRHLHLYALMALSTAASYLLLDMLGRKLVGRSAWLRSWRGLPLRAWNVLVAVLTIGCIATIVGHLAAIGSQPLLAALRSDDFYGIARIRMQTYYGMPLAARYLSDFVASGFLPFLVLYAASRDWRLLAVLAPFSFTYALSLLAKKYIVVQLAPVVLEKLLLRRWWLAAVASVALFLALALLTAAGDPAARSKVSAQPPAAQQDGGRMVPVMHVAHAADTTGSRDTPAAPGPAGWQRAVGLVEIVAAFLHERLFVLPGQIADQWISLFPDRIPFLEGCGYRVLAPLLDCEFVHVPALAFSIYYPHLAGEQGLRGNMNSASFLNDYANFGLVGIVVSGILHAGVLVAIRFLAGGGPFVLALHCFYILVISEAALTNLLFSQGWGVAIVLGFLMPRIQAAGTVAQLRNRAS